MKKPYKILIAAVVGIMVLSAVSVKLSERFIIRTVAALTGNSVNIGSVSFSLPPALHLKDINISHPFADISLKQLFIRPSFSINAFAFSGPGGISASDMEKPMSIKGSISGNFKKGSVNIRQTSIDISSLGSFKLQGILENWGKDGASANINLDRAEISEIISILEMNIPLKGTASGTISLDYSGTETKQTNFNINLKDLSTEEDVNFDAIIKGFHNGEKNRTDIIQGTLSNQEGGRILFSGFIDQEDFRLDFETEDMLLDEFFKLIPENIRGKYNLSVSGGNASMKDFTIEKIKKKSF